MPSLLANFVSHDAKSVEKTRAKRKVDLHSYHQKTGLKLILMFLTFFPKLISKFAFTSERFFMVINIIKVKQNSNKTSKSGQIQKEAAQLLSF